MSNDLNHTELQKNDASAQETDVNQTETGEKIPVISEKTTAESAGSEGAEDHSEPQPYVFDENAEVVVRLNHVTKQFKLFKNKKSRLKSLFSRKVNYTINTANDDLTFEIRRGESVAFLGKNGAGKSTLLKMITGVLFPTSGEVEVKGEVSALLELTAGFDPEFTGRENIYLRGHMRGMSDSKIKSYEEVIIDFADIGEYIDQPVRTYSSGMKARLGFAINANIQPEILIVDEALSVGDAAFRKKCNQIVNKIISEDNTTLLLVTHSGEMAKQFCKRGIVLYQSKVYYDGPIDEAVRVYEEEILNGKPSPKPKANTILTQK